MSFCGYSEYIGEITWESGAGEDAGMSITGFTVGFGFLDENCHFKETFGLYTSPAGNGDTGPGAGRGY